MKKYFIALLMLVSVNMYACHIDPLGWCTGKSFFTLVDAPHNEIVEIQYKAFGSSVWVTGKTITAAATGNTNVTFNFPQAVQTESLKIRFRTRPNVNQGWSGWTYSPDASTGVYAGCIGLPLKFTYFKVSAVSANTYKVEFTAAEAEEVKEFRIEVSTDGKTFKTIFIFTPDGIDPNKTYSTLINL